MRRFDSPPKTHSSLFHYGQLSLMNIIRYFYICTVLKLAIMIFVHFPFLSNQTITKLCIDCIAHKEFRKIDIKWQSSGHMDYSYSVVFTYLRNQLLYNNQTYVNMLHQIFRNKIYFKNKMKKKIIRCIYQSIWMFISCSNDDMYYLLIINE